MANAIKCPICEFENPDGQTKCRRCGTPMPGNDPAPSPQSAPSGGSRLRQGQLLANRYYIVAEIGRGGMGSIYRAKDNTLKEAVALKTLLPQFLQDKHVVERFFNEARIARTLSHPNIVRVHDIGASQGTVYISMELLNGKSLRQVLEGLMPGDRLPMRTVLDIFDQLCAALEYAHRYTVHRDLKPENVMVMDDGSVKLMDFGISKLMGDANLTSASMVMGTPHYMSPEQVKHSAGVDQRADIYSLGVMLYETLTGNLPTAIHKPVSKVVRGVPPALDPIIETCLQDDPNRRFATAGELRAAIAAVSEQLGFTQNTAGSRPLLRPARMALGEPGRLMGFALVALLLIGTGFGVWRAETARQRLVEESLAAQPDVVPPAGQEQPTATPRPAQQLTLENTLPLLPPARFRADSTVRGLPPGDVKTYREQLLKEALEWEAAAKDYAETDADLANSAARKSLQRYLALIQWPQDAVFVPPSETDDGFFIQSRPVTVAAFAKFAQEGEHWRIPAGAGRLSGGAPMEFVTWYDAQAYLAEQKDLHALPTEHEWSRAIDYAGASNALRWIGEVEEHAAIETQSSEESIDKSDAEQPLWVPELWVEDGLLEWNRPDAAGESSPPGFGDLLPVSGVTRIDADVEILRDEQRYERAVNSVGFRGVLRLPATVDGVKNLL